MEAPKIFESEYRFCLILWENEPISSGKLVQLAKEGLGWSKATTYTVIRRLSERGVLKNENTGEVLRNMRTLLTDRLREEGQAFRKGYFILTDLSSGETYRKTSGAMFQFHKDDYLELDWQNAVSDSKRCLQDAAATIAAIRPEEEN